MNGRVYEYDRTILELQTHEQPYLPLLFSCVGIIFLPDFGTFGWITIPCNQKFKSSFYCDNPSETAFDLQPHANLEDSAFQLVLANDTAEFSLRKDICPKGTIQINDMCGRIRYNINVDEFSYGRYTFQFDEKCQPMENLPKMVADMLGTHYDQIVHIALHFPAGTQFLLKEHFYGCFMGVYGW